VSPDIREASVQHGGHAVNLILGVARGLVVVRLRPGQVDGLMGHIQIPATHHGLLPRQLLQVGAERHIPLLAEGQPLEPGRAVGRVHGHEVEAAEIRGRHPAFIVHSVDADAMGHGFRRLTGQDGRAAVSLLDRTGTVDVPIPAETEQGLPDLVVLGLGLLQTEDIQSTAGQPRFEILLHDGAHAIHIPGAEFHGRNLAQRPHIQAMPGGRPQPLATR